MDFLKGNTSANFPEKRKRIKKEPQKSQENSKKANLVDPPSKRGRGKINPLKLENQANPGEAEFFLQEGDQKKEASELRNESGFKIRFDKRRKKESVIRPVTEDVTNVPRKESIWAASKPEDPRTGAGDKQAPARECWEPGGACFEFRLKRATQERIREKIIETVREKLESIDLFRAIREEKVLNFKIQMDAPQKRKRRFFPMDQLNSHYSQNLNSKFELLKTCEARSKLLEKEIQEVNQQIRRTMDQLSKRTAQEFHFHSRNMTRSREKEFNRRFAPSWRERNWLRGPQKRNLPGIPSLETPDSVLERPHQRNLISAQNSFKTQRMETFPEPINKNIRKS